jgi:hypothetical protein
MTASTIKLKVISEHESDVGLPATKSKRTASDMGFEIPPAKRPEPDEGSVTESESDVDVVLPSRPSASALALAQSKDPQSIVTRGCAHLSSLQKRFVSRRLRTIQSQNRSRMTNSLLKQLVSI